MGIIFFANSILPRVFFEAYGYSRPQTPNYLLVAYHCNTLKMPLARHRIFRQILLLIFKQRYSILILFSIQSKHANDYFILVVEDKKGAKAFERQYSRSLRRVPHREILPLLRKLPLEVVC
jgi:hypothetical protein